MAQHTRTEKVTLSGLHAGEYGVNYIRIQTRIDGTVVRWKAFSQKFAQFRASSR